MRAVLFLPDEGEGGRELSLSLTNGVRVEAHGNPPRVSFEGDVLESRPLEPVMTLSEQRDAVKALVSLGEKVQELATALEQIDQLFHDPIGLSGDTVLDKIETVLQSTSWR